MIHQRQPFTANRKWHYLMDAQYSRVGNSLDQPCFTLIARMDKTPPYLVDITQDASDLPDFIKVVDNVVVYEIYDNDSPMMKKDQRIHGSLRTEGYKNADVEDSGA